MKQVKGWWLPDTDTDFDRWILDGNYQKEHRDGILSFLKKQGCEFNNCLDIGAHVGFWLKIAGLQVVICWLTISILSGENQFQKHNFNIHYSKWPVHAYSKYVHIHEHDMYKYIHKSCKTNTWYKPLERFT